MFFFDIHIAHKYMSAVCTYSELLFENKLNITGPRTRNKFLVFVHQNVNTVKFQICSRGKHKILLLLEVRRKANTVAPINKC